MPAAIISHINLVMHTLSRGDPDTGQLCVRKGRSAAKRKHACRGRSWKSSTGDGCMRDGRRSGRRKKNGGVALMAETHWGLSSEGVL